MPHPAGDTATPYTRIASDPEFQELKTGFGRFIFPLTAVFLGWYFLYVLLAVFAPSFMARPVVGNINIGLIMGLLQFVSTFAITMVYRNWANTRFDPTAERLKHHLEQEAAQ